MKKLLYVAHASVMSLIHIQEDKKFLIAQRESGPWAQWEQWTRKWPTRKQDRKSEK